MNKRVYVVKKEDGTFVKLSVRNPNSAETEIADIEYSKAFVKSLKNKIPTSKALERILDESGTWTKKDDEKLFAMVEEGAKLENMLAEGKVDDTEKKKIEARLEELRELSSDMRKEKSSYYNNTAESKASDAQRDCTVIMVTRYADSDLPVWKTLDDFMEETDGNMIYRAVYEYLALINDVEGLPDDKPEVDEAEKTEPVKTEESSK